MKILGIGGSSHDYSFCIVNDGVIEVAVEEERFSRERHAVGYRSNAFSGLYQMLQSTQTELEDYDLIVANSLMSPELLKKNLGNIPFIMINHHLAHAASAFYTSRFDESAIFVADGSGSDNETISFFLGNHKGIRCLEKYYGYIENDFSMDFIRTHSYGEFYSYFTFVCGFDRINAGKTMGLAPYGDNTYVELFQRLFYVDDHNVFCTNYNDLELNRIIWSIYKENDSKTRFKMRANIAFAVQTVLEKCVMKQLNYLYDYTKCLNLCFAGGTALNSILNFKILEKTPFSSVYIMPAASDTGTAIGSALYAYYEYSGKSKVSSWLDNPCIDRQYDKEEYDSTGHRRNPQWLQTPFLGLEYSEETIKESLEQVHQKVQYVKCSQVQLVQSAANDLACGKVIGWYQGRSEIGPRALGNRSILAHPGHPYLKDYINRKIKFREDFRPFAPAVLKEKAYEYFEIGRMKDSPFMMNVVKVREEKKQELGAVTHVDNSARIQTVGQRDNELFYKVIKRFYSLTGLPVVLNTSFNTRGEPMVETPLDALNTYLTTELDTLYLGNYRVQKKSGRKING